MKTTIILFLTLFTITLMALPKSMQLDRYIDNAKSLMESGGYQDYIDAYEYYQKAIKLKIKYPKTFYFDYAKCIIALRANTYGDKSSLKEAKKALNKYLTKTGKKGEHYKEALKLYTKVEKSEKLEKMCKNNSRHCKELVSFFESKSLELKDKYCELGFSEACELLTDYYFTKKDYDKYAEYSEKSCKLNDTDGCSSLSNVYNYGWGRKKNKKLYFKYVEKIIEIAKKYCEQNDKKGCLHAGYYYGIKFDLDGEPKYINERIKFYKKSCDLKSTTACRNLVWIYEDKKLGILDKEKAKIYKDKACEYGYKGYCNNK